jgi:predicted RNA binding protein YcfA (HicA-like mRNA interferase family)
LLLESSRELTYPELITILLAAGCHLHHQSAGSHMIFCHSNRPGSIVVAGCGKLGRDVPRGTENAILRQAGLK